MKSGTEYKIENKNVSKKVIVEKNNKKTVEWIKDEL